MTMVTPRSGFDLEYYLGRAGEKTAGGYYLNAAQQGEPPGRWFGKGAELSGLRYARGGLSLVDTREALIDPVEELRRSSLDPYVTYRTAYRQRPQADIENRIGPAVTNRAHSRSGRGGT